MVRAHKPFAPDRRSCAVLAGLLCAIALSLAPARATPAPKQPAEYEIKAAFLYRFLFFIKWPGDTDGDDNSAPVVIGIVGRDPFDNAFAEIEDLPKGPANRVVEIRRLGPYQPTLDLEACDLLFVSRSARGDVPAIAKRLSGRPVLLVADHPGFIEAGGMINLVLQDRLVRWEINRTAITYAGLRPQAQLLRNAVRIVDKPGDGP